MKVKFTYTVDEGIIDESIARKRLLDLSKEQSPDDLGLYVVGQGGIIQRHRQKAIIDVDSDEMDYPALAKAEKLFLDWFAKNEGGNRLLSYESGPADGKGRYSEYHAYLPVN